MVHKYCSWLVILLTFYSLSTQAETDIITLQNDELAINLTLDSLHDAASKAQKERYLELFTEDGVFMGTDDWERWPRPVELDNYVAERFKDGQGWTYHSIERYVRISADGNTAWFDEITESVKWGKFRGTGVVVKQAEGWKIAHYAMSFLVPNEVWEQVSELSKPAFEQRNNQ
ncbi:nuclear transport factor 2 family protein [Paraglaciecola hydrolytica]|uniref:SnoaL-like domain-containing protein n=1 Tax=Paraglaciecola hydrolytica TaxID=1799789 RepID=A0A148KLX1_9ALTE|nr:nuclear transport factor 2 family protein [Paraglaciecola hydrolytica]KXI27323.1 hypothetical protein AX660_21600 [Paraglaciecola hydrolytica]